MLPDTDRHLHSMSSIAILAQNPGVTNWLTPIWLLSVGISIGFALVLIGLLKIWFVSKIPGLNNVPDSGNGRFVALGLLLAAVYIAIGVAFYYWAFYGWKFVELAHQGLPLYLAFLVPASVLIGMAAWKLATPKGANEVFNLTREGFLFWVSIICSCMVAFSLTGYGLAVANGFGLVKFVDEPYTLLNSATRIPFTGVTDIKEAVEPTENKTGGQEIAVDLYGQEVSLLTIRSDQPLEIAAEPISKEVPPNKIHSIEPASTYTPFFRRPDGNGPIPDGKIDKLYVVNIGNRPATLEMGILTQPVYPQVWIIPWSAFFVVLLFSLYWSIAVLFPKLFAIAFSTFKTEVNQPLFLVVLLAGLLFILFSIWIPYNTFGEDIKMYKDSGLTLIRVLAIFMAVWAASKSVAEEIDGRTALTVLSKPVGRRQFIIGKFGGISLMIALLFLMLGTWFVIWTAYKPIYDGRETAQGLIEWETAFVHGIGIIPALFLVFLEVVIFVAISVAISTRLGILANFLICFAIYVLGHLTPLIVQSAVGEFEIVQAFGNLIAIIFPVLNHFDVQAAINTNSSVPLPYVGWSVIYCALYGSISMLVALVLFEDRDLA